MCSATKRMRSCRAGIKTSTPITKNAKRNISKIATRLKGFPKMKQHVVLGEQLINSQVAANGRVGLGRKPPKQKRLKPENHQPGELQQHDRVPRELISD